jgi:hypothetical protein
MKKIFLLALVSFIIARASAQSITTTSTVRPSFIGLFVHNIDSMMHWYEHKLEFNVLQFKKPKPDLGFAMLEWNGLWIEMIQNPKTLSRDSIHEQFPEAKDAEGFFKLGFYTSDLETLEKKFRQQGIKFVYPMMTNDTFKMRLFIIKDPEGNWLQFYNTEGIRP